MSRQGAFWEIIVCSAVGRCHETQARELAHPAFSDLRT